MGELGDRHHAVLTCDVVGSRDVPDRQALQDALRRLLADLNDTFAGIIRVPFSISVGDEFQGVAAPDGRLVRLIDTMQRTLHPVRVRVGVGIGAVSTDFASRSQEMDGPAFLFAREALDLAKAQTPQAWLCFRTADEAFDLAANGIALLLGLVKERWKPLHWSRAALRDQGLNAEEIARREGVTQAAVSFALSSSGYLTVRQAESNLAGLIDSWWVHKSTDL